ncbi:hypothetical protein TRVL_03590 [Trypanosoma vivax]|nr:hypothetical protein TRVL_03590 [Trypanosoma vivax]
MKLPLQDQVLRLGETPRVPLGHTRLRTGIALNVPADKQQGPCASNVARPHVRGSTRTTSFTTERRWHKSARPWWPFSFSVLYPVAPAVVLTLRLVTGSVPCCGLSFG